ncbi:MAG: CDP-alcohol phosphatidyltransferase family protein [Candidatus Binatia bacterium]
MALDLSGGSVERLPGSQIIVWCADGEARIAGVELWRRAIYTACRAGFERLLIVTPAPAETVRRALGEDARLQGRDWQVISADDRWAERISGFGGRWVALEDRWVTDAALLRELAETRGEPAAASTDGPIAADADMLARLAYGGWNPSRRPEPAPRCVVARPDVYLRVESNADLPRAEDALFQSLARNTTNFFARWIDRPMSRAISRRLAPYPITPNQITIFSTGLGIVGALCMLHPSYTFGVLGAFLFLASTVIDGCDGEIARLKFQESAAGAKLDVICDNVVHAFLFPCVALRAYFIDPSGPYLALGAFAFGGVVATWIAIYFLIVRGKPSRRLTALFEFFGNREFAYLFFALAVAGMLDWFVWAAAFGLWAFPLGLFAIWLLGL